MGWTQHIARGFLCIGTSLVDVLEMLEAIPIVCCRTRVENFILVSRTLSNKEKDQKIADLLDTGNTSKTVPRFIVRGVLNDFNGSAP